MVAKFMYQRARVSTAILACCSISKSPHLSACIAGSYLVSSRNFHSRSRPLIHSRMCCMPVLLYQSLNERINGMRYLCTDTKQGKFLQEADLSDTSSEQVTYLGKGSVVEDDVLLSDNKPTEQISADNLDVQCKSEYAHEGELEEPIDRTAVIELEVELLRQDGFTVPDKITQIQWETLLSEPTRSSRKRYLRFLFVNEKKSEKEKKQKQVRKLLREKKKEEKDSSRPRYLSEDGHIQYGLWCNSIFLRIYESSMDNFNNWRVMSAVMHGQPLVVDLGYENRYSGKEAAMCAKQLMNMYSKNRSHADPFHLNLCDAKRSSELMKRLHKRIPVLYDVQCAMTVNEESYLDCFPKEDLVYLTPHCSEVMTEYDHKAIYIIGGLVDIHDAEPVSYAKAKKQGIKMQRFPLERYLAWGMGSKSLALSIVLEILLDLKLTGSWKYALKHVPQRKLKSYEDTKVNIEGYLRNHKHLKSTSRYKQQEMILKRHLRLHEE